MLTLRDKRFSKPGFHGFGADSGKDRGGDETSVVALGLDLSLINDNHTDHARLLNGVETREERHVLGL